ncbi:hypothetical protein MMC14_008550 [Varicellaria rhodocarpa]|nr:hypothetical protein [Varicellaria rhodocarpa]
MVTVTVESDTIQVVVNIGVSVETEPWFAETTYLIDSLGHTTALIAQTAPAASTYDITPVPWTPTPVAAAAAPLTTSTASPVPTSAAASTTAAAAFTTSPITLTPSPTQSGVPSSKGDSTLLIGMGVAGAIVGLLALATAYYLWRKAMKRSEESSQSYGDGSSKSSSSYSSSSTAMFRPWGDRPTADLTWSEFIDEFQDEYARYDESKISFQGDYPSRIGEGRSSQGGYRETVEEKQERLWRLANRSHSPPPAYVDEKDGRVVSFREESETIYSSPQIPRPTLKFPLSILKRPPTPTPSVSGARPVNRPLFNLLPTTIQNVLGESPDPTYTPNFAERPAKTVKAKKGVRFGVDQIKEFGRTPAASVAGSVRSQSMG